LENTALRRKKQELGLDIEPFIFDVGCETARAYLQITTGTAKIECKCRRCPFPHCIYAIPLLHKRFLNASVKIRNMFFLLDNGLALCSICSKLRIDINFAKTCIKNRKTVEQLLNEWELIIKHGICFNNDTIEIRETKLQVLYGV